MKSGAGTAGEKSDRDLSQRRRKEGEPDDRIFDTSFDPDRPDNRERQMSRHCPISSRRSDAYTDRIEALFTALTVAAFLATCTFVLPLLLAADFVLRLLTHNRHGLFRPLSERCRKLLNLPRRPVDDAPKRFARLLGAILSINLVLLYTMQMHSVAVILASLFMAFALLEALFDFCIGCRIYTLAIRTVKR